jgi:hypothetical protein
MGPDRRVSPLQTPREVRVGLHRRLWQLPIVVHFCNELTRSRSGPVNGYPLHPSELDIISAVGIKDQALTIIVSMILIELTLLRLGRAAFFQRLRCLTRKGSSYWSRCIRELGWRDARDDELGQEGEFKGAEYSEFRNPSVTRSPFQAEDAEKAG